MALADLIAFAKLILETVSGIGLVHTSQPIAMPGSAIPDEMKTGGVVHFWTITEGPAAETRGPSTLETEITHTIFLRGRYAVKAPHERITEPAFHALTALVRTAFRPIHSYDVSPNRFDMVGPLSRTVVGHQLIADVELVHFVELNWPALEIVDSRP